MNYKLLDEMLQSEISAEELGCLLEEMSFDMCIMMMRSGVSPGCRMLDGLEYVRKLSAVLRTSPAFAEATAPPPEGGGKQPAHAMGS